jgi:hypothetical protein
MFRVSGVVRAIFDLIPDGSSLPLRKEECLLLCHCCCSVAIDELVVYPRDGEIWFEIWLDGSAMR